MKKIAIIGGGPTAVATLLQIIRCCPAVQLSIYDEKPIGFGTAFNTHTIDHLCNTSVSQNSIDADNPDDFLEYLSSQGWAVSRKDFVPRYLVAQYCRERYLSYAQLAKQRRIVISHVRAELTSIRNGPSALCLATSKEELETADAVAVCVGSRQKTDAVCLDYESAELSYQRAISQPYPSNKLLEYARGKRKIVVLGTKLSAIDAAITLCTAGKTVTLVSPSGAFPSVRTALTNNQSNSFSANSISCHYTPRSFISHINRTLKTNGAKTRVLSGSPFEMLSHEISSAERGDNLWQGYIADLIDFSNDVLSAAGADVVSKVRGRTRPLVSRYVSSIPLENARKLMTYYAQGKLKLRRSSDHRISFDGRNFTLDTRSAESYDGLVLATGTQNPIVVKQGSELKIDYCAPADANCASESELKSHKVWIVGAAIANRFPIVNYLRFSVLRSKIVVNEIVRELYESRSH